MDWSAQSRFGVATGGDEQLWIFAYNKRFTKARELARQTLRGDAQAVAVRGNRMAVAVSDEQESSVFVKTSKSGGVLLAASEDSGTVDSFKFNLSML